MQNFAGKYVSDFMGLRRLPKSRGRPWENPYSHREQDSQINWFVNSNSSRAIPRKNHPNKTRQDLDVVLAATTSSGHINISVCSVGACPIANE